ncbi:MAG: glycosyltransferase, partial [Coprobacillus sp.]|nr:glycosyltransferase [Coprobacillus sp.]
MNILMFSDTYPPFINGVSTSVFNLVKTLKEHGNNVLLVTPRYNKGDFEYKDGVIYLPGVELKWLYGYRFPRPFDKKVMDIIKEFKPDVIHYHTDSTLGIFARRVARRIKKPIVYTYHTNYEDYTYYVTRGFVDRAAKRIVRFYSRTIAKNTTEFITPSDKTKDFFRTTRNDIYINVIPTGIDFSSFKRKEEEKEKEIKFKKEHHIDDQTKIFLLLGRLAKEKSMDVSIRGFAKFIKEHPEIKAKMLVVGGGPARNELELLT